MTIQCSQMEGGRSPLNFCPQDADTFLSVKPAVAGAKPPSLGRVVKGSRPRKGRTCSAPSGAEQDKRQRAGGVARGGAGRKVPRGCPRASPTPRGARGPPLSPRGKDKGGEPEATTLVFFRGRSVWGNAPSTLLGGTQGRGLF